MNRHREYIIHPLYILITLVLGSITSLFLGFTVAYVYSRIQNGQSPVAIPVLFYFNTIILLATSYIWILIKKAYEEDQTHRYKLLLASTLGLSILFLFAQIVAWNQLLEMNITLTSSNLASYLYVISAIHFLHVIGGIPFLIFFIKDAQKRLVEPHSVLVYLSDPDKKRRIEVLSIYWHFLDALWIYLILFFFVNRLIS
jgi:cytochrome c oxidase subunit III